MDSTVLKLLCGIAQCLIVLRDLPNGMTAEVIWDVVRAAAAQAGIDKLAPHDLRRPV